MKHLEISLNFDFKLKDFKTPSLSQLAIEMQISHVKYKYICQPFKSKNGDTISPNTGLSNCMLS